MIAVIKNFQEVIETKDIGRMTKELYEFLNLYCGFIAHYDINGFKATYKAPGFLPGSSSGTLTETPLLQRVYACHETPYKNTGMTKAEIKRELRRS